MQIHHYFLRSLLIILLLVPASRGMAQKRYAVSDIPNPREHGIGSVSDPDQILTQPEVDSLNAIVDSMEAKTGVQTAVVIVSDLAENDDEFDAAVELFRKWGIGKKNADNGLLLMVAVDRRKYRFVTGYGVEGLLPDADLILIGQHDLVPAFKRSAYGEGMIRAMTTVAAYLQQPANHKELAQLLTKRSVNDTDYLDTLAIAGALIGIFVLITRFIKKRRPPIPDKKKKESNSYEMWGAGLGIALFLIGLGLLIISGFDKFEWWENAKASTLLITLYLLLAFLTLISYLYAIGSIRKAYQDDLNFYNAKEAFIRKTWLVALFSPAIIIILINEWMKQKHINERFTAPINAEGDAMVRVDRDQNIDGKPYLSEGQRKEETIGVYCYDIWVSPRKPDSFKIIQHHGDKFNSHTVCPQCGFKTMMKPTVKTIVSPTYSKQGQGKKVSRCEQCKHEELIAMVTIPMLTKSSSSSSSSSGSGSSSSSSSSSSYGGGSTGGGGAGGSW